MIYGVTDIARNMVGMSANSKTLRNGEFWALDDVSLQLEKGQTLGIIGSNGSGKSTLLKMLNGIYWPDRGKISIQGKVGALIEVGAGFHPLLTGRENVYLNGAILGMSRREVEEKFDVIVDFADIAKFIDTPVKYYSSGMYVRLGFAVAIHCNPDILLIDEVLAVGDVEFQSKCFKFLTDKFLHQGKSVVLVSHSRHTVQDLCSKVAYLEKGVLQEVGETVNVLDRYMSDVAKHSKAAGEEGSHQTLSPEIKLIVQFLDGDGHVIDTVSQGQAARIRFHYDLGRVIEKPSFSLTLLHSDPRYHITLASDYLFNLHSGYDHVAIPHLSGKGFIDVDINQFYLPVGQYKVLTYIYENNHVNLIHKNNDAGWIEVLWPKDNTRRSLIELPHHWHAPQEDKL